MAWHDVVAWVVVAVAFVVAAVWVSRRIVCPPSRCEGCNKECALRREKRD